MKSIFKRPLRVCLIMVLTLSLTAGCAVFRAYWEWSSYYEKASEGRIFPKKPRFQITAKTVINPLAVIPAVYARQYVSTNQTGDVHVNYDFIRLWSSGHCYGRNVKGKAPTIDDVESFKQAYLGFYTIDGNEFSMELYFPDIYQRIWGQIDNNKIEITHSEQRYNHNGPVYKAQASITYYRLPISGAHRPPDWSPTGMLQRVPGRLGKDEADTKTIVP